MRAAPLLLSLLLTLPLVGCSLPSYEGLRPEQEPQALAKETSLPVPAPKDPALRNLGRVRMLRLTGDGYARGFQYGQACATGWQRSWLRMQRAAIHELWPTRAFLGVPRLLTDALTASVYLQVDDGSRDAAALARMPLEYRAYMQGIADGAGMSVHDLQRVVAAVMLSDASCCGFIAFGPATDDGRLIQLRNLDWGSDILRPQTRTILLIHEPTGGARYLSLGFIGLVGSVSGINEHGISLTEIGSKTADKSRAGIPMPLMLERILAEAKTLDDALRIMRESPGTGGYNFLIGSAKERRGAAVEKTAHRTAVFKIGEESYRENPFFKDFEGFDCRADTAADPQVRRYQLCSGGDPSAATPPSPARSGAYRRRYKAQLDSFEKFGRRLSIEKAAELAARSAPRSNLHSILYDFERATVYLRNKAWPKQGAATKAQERQMRAAIQAPIRIDLRRVFPGASFRPLAPKKPEQTSRAALRPRAQGVARR